MPHSKQPYAIFAEDAASITKVEMAFGTSRLLPPMEAIPEEFLGGTGTAKPYHDLVNAIFYGWPLPEGEIELAPGVSAETLRNCVSAHLRSWEPKHEHKIAGVAYLVRKFARLVPAS